MTEAHVYSDRYRAAFGPAHAAEAVALIADLAEDTEYDRALAIGAVCATTAFGLAAHARQLVIAVSTAALCEQAGKTALVRGLPNLRIGIAAAHRLPYGDGTFDLVTSRVSGGNYHRARPALDEVVRVLGSDGMFILCDAASPQENWLGPDAFIEAEQGTAQRLPSPAAWCRLLEEHGLRVDTTVTTRTIAEADDRPERAQLHRSERGSGGAMPIARLERAPVGRDAALSRFPWRGTIIRARKP